MADHDIFVSAGRTDEVRAVIETELGAAFSASDDPDAMQALMTGATKVFFHDSHDLEDDHDFAVTRYRYWVNVHDSARNEQDQFVVAERIFDAVKARGWPAMLSFNLQGHIALHP
jgi:hypothetical protein